MPLHVRLVVVGGDVKASEITLRLPCTIGRGRGNTIMLPHPLVSRQHCEIFERDGALFVRDLGSLNGTFVNNVRITDPAPLPANELLTIGTVTFRAVYEGAESDAVPPAAEERGAVAASQTLPAAPVARRTTPGRPSAAAKISEPRTVDFEQTAPAPGESLPPEAQLPAAAKTQPTPTVPKPQAASSPAPKVGSEPSPAPAPKIGPPPDLDEPVEEAEDRRGEDDDLNDFLKSLGKK
jgi:pSer/pThr/pTyr-binding forkhead associated (FHA) protein